eukprot:7346479-Prymnesium_polylepis.1
MCSWCCEERARAPRTALSGRVGWVGLGGFWEGLSAAAQGGAPATVSYLASHVACSVSLRTAR